MNRSRMNLLELKAVPAFINHPPGTEKGHVPGEGPAPPVESARHPSASRRDPQGHSSLQASPAFVTDETFLKMYSEMS